MQFATPHPTIVHDPYLEIDCKQFKIIGRTISGVETLIAIPQWSLAFDTGRSPDFAFSMNTVALSHWHLDHSGGLASILGLRCLHTHPPLQIIVPYEKFDESESFLSHLKSISQTEIQYILKTADTPVHIKNDFFIRALPSFHCTPATGYLVSHHKHRLKNEFQGRTEAEIIKAKRQGLSVEEKVVEPLLAYSGDSKWEFFETEAVKARHLIMECSFFSDKSDYEKVRRFGHTHILDWQDHAEKIESETVIMIHTSLRYNREDIETACRKYLPKTLLDRLIILR